MENINSTNLFNNINQTKLLNINNQNKQGENLLEQNKTPVLINSAITPNLIFDYNSAKMDSVELLKFLQSILKLPNSLDELLKSIALKNTTLKNLNNNEIVNIKALVDLLTTNSTKAKEILFQTITTSLKTQNLDISQMREILSFVSTIANNNQNIDTTLKELMLLYIPINFEALNKEVNFKVEDNEQEKINSSNLSILFETINFSNILCCLNKSKTGIFVDLFINKSFPLDRFSALAKEYSSKTSISVSIDFRKTKENDKKADYQNLKVISQGQINSDILSLAHYISKIIFKIDDDFTRNNGI